MSEKSDLRERAENVQNTAQGVIYCAGEGVSQG